MDSFPFTDQIIGGALIGLASVLLLVAQGRIFGVSGIVGGVISSAADRGWRIALILGFLVSGFWMSQEGWQVFGNADAAPSNFVLVVAGLLVGYGTRLGSGCTSGHGICGISRLSVRSIVATLCFIASGVLTVTLMRMLGGH
jgi:uncharacterized membrane protein YedE/YeeE